MTGHWGKDDFIGAVYGVGPDDGHLEQCADCRAKLAAYRVRAETLRQEVGPEISDERLAAQRRAIYARLHDGRRSGVRKLAPAIAAAGMVAAGLLLFHPGTDQQRPPANVAVMDNASSDSQFFDEVAALEQSPEPRAAQTVRELFEP